MVADESKRLIKAYVLQTFQETLDAIGEQATNILAAIPNMTTSTVYFEGCKETKSGSIKDEVVAILNTDGNNDIPIKSLSGGERTAIDLAIDLAVIDVIETKASKGANFLFMDEPFDGLDSVCKENCLEILKQIDTNKKIIMVDHSSELKEMVSDVILVIKKGETSSVMVL
jgi:DNA repair exonuclease SbcCD ATPase subunit